MIENKTSYVKLTAAHINNNFALCLKGSGKDYITEFKITAIIENPAIDLYSPPPPNDLQYDYDRQAQLRAYAQSIKYYLIGIYSRKNNDLFLRCTVPLYKIFPCYEVDLFPKLWSSSQGIIEKDEELLIKFQNTNFLPTAADSIICSLSLFTVGTNTVSTWFEISLPAKTEVRQILPLNSYEVNFKQIGTPQSKLFYSFLPNVPKDELNPEFDRTEAVPNPYSNNSIYFYCENQTKVMLKVYSM